MAGDSTICQWHLIIRRVCSPARRSKFSHSIYSGSLDRLQLLKHWHLWVCLIVRDYCVFCHFGSGLKFKSTLAVGSHAIITVTLHKYYFPRYVIFRALRWKLVRIQLILPQWVDFPPPSSPHHHFDCLPRLVNVWHSFVLIVSDDEHTTPLIVDFSLCFFDYFLYWIDSDNKKLFFIYTYVTSGTM
jgi:hypothetical protein